MLAEELLKSLNACNEAIEWAGDKTIEEAWESCHRGDWMLLFYSKQYSLNIKELTLAKGYCANTVLHLMKDDRSKKAVRAAIDFGNGLITEDELEIFASAASASADAYSFDVAASYAASFDVASAYAASAAADASYYAADASSSFDVAAAYAASAYSSASAAADAAYYAAYDAAYDASSSSAVSAYYAADAKKQNQLETANICRKYLKIGEI